MKTVITPATPEKAEYYSDFSGEPFEQGFPAVEVSIRCHYGSRRDGASVQLDLSDREADELLSWISKRLCKKSRDAFKKELASVNKNIESSIQCRDWQGADLSYDEADLIQFLVGQKKKGK